MSFFSQIPGSRCPFGPGRAKPTRLCIRKTPPSPPHTTFSHDESKETVYAVLHRYANSLRQTTVNFSQLTFLIPDFPNSPNPWKAAIVLEELGLEYNIVRLGVFAVKQKPYTDLNPNGRTPCLVDHNNNNFAIWEVSELPNIPTSYV